MNLYLENSQLLNPEIEKTRTNYLVIGPEKVGTDGFLGSRLLEARKILSDKEVLVVGAMDAFGLTADNWLARRWPRNYINQIGNTIFVREGVDIEKLSCLLRKITEKGGIEFSIVLNELLGNGGRVMYNSGYLVIPLEINQQDIKEISKGMRIVALPTPQLHDFQRWLKSMDKLFFEEKKLIQLSEINIREIYDYFMKRSSIPDCYEETDLDFFVGLVRLNGKVAILIDELYERIYKDRIQLPEGLEKITVDSYEAGISLGCNCLQIGDFLVVSDKCPKLIQSLKDHGFKGEILPLPLDMVNDIRGTSGFHCSFSEINLSLSL